MQNNSIIVAVDLYNREINMKKLLIVDDDEHTVKLLINCVDKFFLCEIFTATNGKEALDIIDRVTPEVIILDICMPVMDGLQMLENLRLYRQNDTVVIPLSAITDYYTIDKIMALGVSDYITKPIMFDKVINSLDKYLPPRNNYQGIT